jgi:hypothetical protein
MLCLEESVGLLYYSEIGERLLFGADIIREAEKQVQIIRENLRIAPSR